MLEHTQVTHISNTKRVQVSFTKGQWSIIESLRGKFGDSDSQIVRGIVISWLAEKSILSSSVKLDFERLQDTNTDAYHERNPSQSK
jgi:hypothetical protein